MISLRFATAAALAAVLLAQGGCASRMPPDKAQRVRAIMASQMAAPRPAAPDAGAMDGVAAVAAHANYQQSFTSPTPQSDSPSFGKN